MHVTEECPAETYAWGVLNSLRVLYGAALVEGPKGRARGLLEAIAVVEDHYPKEDSCSSL